MEMKQPFWKMTAKNEKAAYACLNYGEAYTPGEIRNRSICLDGDIAHVFEQLTESSSYLEQK